MTDRIIYILTVSVIITSLLLSPVYAKELSVPSAYPKLAGALAAAESGDVIEIAPGQYYESGLIMKSGVKIIGLGNSPRDVVIDGNGRGRILLCEGLAELAILENLTFTRGHAAGHNSYDQSGGALLVSHSNLIIDNCDFLENRADGHGGAIRASYSSPQIKNCQFINNSAPGGGGGGIECSYGSTPQIVSCLFAQNTASWGGAVACRGDSSAQVRHSLFQQNSVLDGKAYGGAVFSDFESTPMFDTCTFVENLAVFGGGLACFQNSATHLINCTLVGNEVSWLGGGLFSYDASPVISQCLFSYQTGTSLTAAGNSLPLIANSNFFGNSRGDWGGLVSGQLEVRSNMSQDPLFCSDTPIADLNFTLQSDSPCSPDVNTPGLIGAWPAGCEITPVLFDGLIAHWNNGQVHLSWTLANKDETPSFRITGSAEDQPDVEWNLTYSTPAIGEYFAIDQQSGSDPDTRFIYRLYVGQVDETWLQIGEATVSSPPPAPVSEALEAWPNPFNPLTTISFSVKRDQTIRVSIFDIEGRLVQTLVKEHLSRGRHQVTWNGKGADGQRVSSGTYIVLVDGQDNLEAGKLTLLK